MRFKKVINLFSQGNTCVVGLRGNGKDMLMSNVVVRRKLPYVANLDYGGDEGLFRPFNPLDYDIKNSYKNFIEGKLTAYEYPHPDGTDIYISDCGVYFPAQYCSELNKLYGGLISFMALSRHLGACNVHINVQNLNRAWDKIREQSDIYIACNRCLVLFGKIVLQSITLYESYDSCVKRVPPFSMKRPLMDKNRQQQWELAYEHYRCTYGRVQSKILLYINKSTYDTRFFKTLLAPKVQEVKTDA